MNEVKTIDERRGYSAVSPGSRNFVEFINAIELLDLPLIGRRFTWTNFQERCKFNRLDRFLISQDWLDKFKIRQ